MVKYLDQKFIKFINFNSIVKYYCNLKMNFIGLRIKWINLKLYIKVVRIASQRKEFQ